MADADPRPGDPGIFGPDSITWRIHADPSMALGGLRALMLQALHPLAMAGVSQHSSYRRDPWGRLFRTAEYIGTITYGTTEEAIAAGLRVRRVHKGLAGVEPESGQPYRVEDTRLLTWVHCAEIDSFLHAYRRSGGRLAPGDADTYVGEQLRAAALVGVDPEDAPSTAAELHEYMERMRPELRATAEARDALTFLFSPPMPTPARPAWLYLTSLSFGLLPRWARRAYGTPAALTATPVTDVAAALNGRVLSAALRLVPEQIRSSPARRQAIARTHAS